MLPFTSSILLELIKTCNTKEGVDSISKNRMLRSLDLLMCDRKVALVCLEYVTIFSDVFSRHKINLLEML